MQTQVIRISIRLTVDPVSSSESVGETPYISEDIFYRMIFILIVRNIGGLVPTPLFILEAS